MRRMLALAAVSAAVLTIGAAPAHATDECDGLMVCIPVAGPWVLVPTGGGIPRPQVEYQLSCPRGHIVGGLDAELSQRGIDIAFLGRLGSPVNPGITTSRAVVFVARYVGATARAPTFRPHIGCIPSSGGGRVPTATAVVKPGRPTVSRVRTARVRPGTTRVARACNRREHLVGASHAFGFFTRRPPTESLISSVSGTRSVSGNRVTVTARGDAELGSVRAVVQVHAVCSRVR
jgi:hypothetical protein